MKLEIDSLGSLHFSQEMSTRNGSQSTSSEENLSMEQELEKQLHEQYATNNNAYLNSIIVLFVGLLAAIGAYGYVFIHTYADCLSTKCFCAASYNLTQLLYVTIASIIVLSIMLYICIYQGFAQRYEQFITHAIRCKYHSQFKQQDNNSNKPIKIFPDTYHPFGKKRTDAIQGLYGVFAKIISVVIVLLIAATLSKIVTYEILWRQSLTECEVLCIILAIVIVGSFMYCHKLYCEKKERYHELENEYAQYNPKNKQTPGK